MRIFFTGKLLGYPLNASEIQLHPEKTSEYLEKVSTRVVRSAVLLSAYNNELVYHVRSKDK